MYAVSSELAIPRVNAQFWINGIIAVIDDFKPRRAREGALDLETR